MGIYYSRHNYAVGRFVSQSIRTQLFIRLPVIALRWRHASHTYYTRMTHTYTVYASKHKQTHAHTLFSLPIYHYKNKRKLQEKSGGMTIAPSCHFPTLSSNRPPLRVNLNVK